MYSIVGVNLLIGTEAGLMLLDRSGQGKGNIVILLKVHLSVLVILL